MQSSSSGDYAAWWKELRLVVHDVPRAPKTVVDGAGGEVAFDYDAAKKTLVVTQPGSATDFRFAATW